jgi:alternate signal-mediated exported protein
MTRTVRPRPSTTGSALAAAAASLLALTLLGGSLGTFARWSDEVPLETRAVSTGALGVTLGPERAVHHHIDLDPATGTVRRESTGLTGSAEPLSALAPGDTVVVTARATLDVEGTNLTATLTVDPGVPAAGAVVPRVELTPVPGAPAPSPGPGQASWTVTAAQDGAAYDVTVSYEVSPDPSAQGATVEPGPLTVALVQN